MAYKVIRRFSDLTDKAANFPNGYPYELDDVFPREGHTPSDDFVQGLLTGSNTAGSIFITFSDDDKDDFLDNERDTPGDIPDNPDDEQDTPGDDNGTEDENIDNPDGLQGTSEPPASESEKPKRKRSTKAKEV